MNKYHCTFDDCVAREAEDVAVQAGWTRLVDLDGELLGRCPVHAESDTESGLGELFDSLEALAGALFFLDYKFDYNYAPGEPARLLDVVGEFNAKVAEPHHAEPVPFKESVVLLDEPFKPNRELMREILMNSCKKNDDV